MTLYPNAAYVSLRLKKHQCGPAAPEALDQAQKYNRRAPRLSANFFKNMVVTPLIPYNRRFVFRGVQHCLCGTLKAFFTAEQGSVDAIAKMITRPFSGSEGIRSTWVI
jgi:hypothetical protein